ncbi:hypothetical protein, partial [Pseudolactococcus reticulitermitis]
MLFSREKASELLVSTITNSCKKFEIKETVEPESKKSQQQENITTADSVMSRLNLMKNWR